jgi:hypothetical protein
MGDEFEEQLDDIRGQTCMNLDSLMSPQNADGMVIAGINIAQEVTPNNLSFRLLNNIYFEYFMAVVIISNGIYVALVTDYLAKSGGKDVPSSRIIEPAFFAVFVFEIGLRLYVHRSYMFRAKIRSGRANLNLYWNYLDTTVIFCQAFEFLSHHASISISISKFSVIRLMRLFRLIRVVRVIKVFKFVRDLRVIVFSIWRSLSLFFWSLTALLLSTLMFSIYFTSVVLNSKLNPEPGTTPDIPALDKYFGHVSASLMSLLMAVTGGIDWGDLVEILDTTGDFPFTVLPFLGYIMFTLLAMTNVITGVFLETPWRGRRRRETSTWSATRAGSSLPRTPTRLA